MPHPNIARVATQAARPETVSCALESMDRFTTAPTPNDLGAPLVLLDAHLAHLRELRVATQEEPCGLRQRDRLLGERRCPVASDCAKGPRNRARSDKELTSRTSDLIHTTSATPKPKSEASQAGPPRVSNQERHEGPKPFKFDAATGPHGLPLLVGVLHETIHGREHAQALSAEHEQRHRVAQEALHLKAGQGLLLVKHVAKRLLKPLELVRVRPLAINLRSKQLVHVTVSGVET